MPATRYLGELRCTRCGGAQSISGIGVPWVGEKSGICKRCKAGVVKEPEVETSPDARSLGQFSPEDASRSNLKVNEAAPSGPGSVRRDVDPDPAPPASEIEHPPTPTAPNPRTTPRRRIVVPEKPKTPPTRAADIDPYGGDE